MVKRPKIALIGAGNIGGTLAHLLINKKLGDIVLFDVKEDFPQGKALDLLQASAIDNTDLFVHGTNNYEDIAGATVVIVTAGSARKPGMSRDDLLSINAHVIKEVGTAIQKHAPDAFVLCVTNPLDAMVYLLQASAGLPDQRIVGMAGVLDSARFRCFLAQHFKTSLENVQALVLGGHGDTMIPLTELSHVYGLSLAEHVSRGTLTQTDLDAIVHRTRFAGGEIVSLLKTGSAYYAPAASAIQMAEAVLLDKKLLVSAATKITSGYGVTRPMFLGVPVLLGAQGVEKVVELPLTDQEKKAFEVSVQAVSEQLDDLHRLNFI